MKFPSIIIPASITSLILSSGVLAFKNTSPLLLWSSRSNPALDGASSQLSAIMQADEVYSMIGKLGCAWESLVIVNVNELHHSHLSSLKLPSSPNLHVPYLKQTSRTAFDRSIESWAKSCDAQVVSSLSDLDPKREKNVVVVLSANQGEDVQSLITSAQLVNPDILLLTGSAVTPAANTAEKRQEERPIPQPPTSTTKTLSASASHRPTASSSATSTSKPNNGNDNRNSTIPPSNAPLLTRYQLVTTPIITAVLISFLIFIPIVAFGVYSLVSIQVPSRMMEISKGLVGRERKEQ